MTLPRKSCDCIFSCPLHSLPLQDSRRYLSELSTSWGRDSAVLLREAGAAIEEVRREACGQSATAARLSALEDKLAVLDRAVVGAGGLAPLQCCSEILEKVPFAELALGMALAVRSMVLYVGGLGGNLHCSSVSVAAHPVRRGQLRMPALQMIPC